MQDGIMPLRYVGSIPATSALLRWNNLIMEASTKAGRSWANVKHYPQYFKDAGFEDVQELSFYWPTNPWPKGKYFKTLSVYFQQDFLDGLEGITMKLFTNLLGWTAEEVYLFLVDVRNDVRDRNIHAYLLM